MKKSIFLFFAAILCAIGMNAATWTVAGSDAKILNGTSTWAPGDTKNDMINVSGTKWGLLVMNKSLAKTTYKFKVCKDHGWGTAYPGSDYNFTIGAAGTYNIIYRFNTNGNTVGADYFKTWTVAGSGAVLGDDWKPEATANDMTRNGNTFEYVLTKKDVKLEKGEYGCKVCKDHDWGTAYPGNDYKFSVATTGYYDVTFTFNVATETVNVTTTLINCKVTTSANPTEGGSVTATKEYAKGSSVTLTATPEDGYEFVNWTKEGAIVSTSKTYTFTVLEDVSLVANFKVPVPDVVKYQVNVSANNNTMGNVTGGGEYEENTTALLTATPKAGYKFVNWTVAGAEVSTANPYTFTVNEDVTVTANFEELPKETIYFVNNKGWKTVNAYAWNKPSGVNNGWPGVAATKTEEKVAGFDVYSFTAIEGQYTNVIFNGDGSQTADLVWTAGKYYWMGAETDFAGATKEEVETKLAAPVEYESVYFVNAQNWTAVNIYTWSPEIDTWPGKAMTEEEENQIAGYAVYSYTVEKGTTFGGMKFNEGNGKRETGDLTWNAGKYYVIDNWYTKAEAEAKLATLVKYDYYIAGTKAMTGHEWNAAGLGMEGDAEKGMYSHDFTLAAGSHEFKVTNGTWDSSWGFSNVARKYKEVSEGKNEKGEPNGNVKITLDKETAVTVVFYSKDKTIEFNGLTLIHTIKVTAENGTVEGAGEYEEGAEATLTATAAEGYEFTCWTSGKDTVSTTNPYKFTVTADLALVANFKKAATEVVLENAYKEVYTIMNRANFFGEHATYGDISVQVNNYNGYGTYEEGVSSRINGVKVNGSATFVNNGETDLLTATLTDAEGTVYIVKAEVAAPKTYNVVATEAQYTKAETWAVTYTVTGLSVDEENYTLTIYAMEEGNEASMGEEGAIQGLVELSEVEGVLTVTGTLKDAAENKYVLNFTATPKPATIYNLEFTDMLIETYSYSDNLYISAENEDYSIELQLVDGKINGYGEYGYDEGWALVQDAYISWDEATLAEETAAKYYLNEETDLAVVEVTLVCGGDIYNITMTGNPLVNPEDIVPTDTVNAVITNGTIEIKYNMMQVIQGESDELAVSIIVSDKEATSATVAELGASSITFAGSEEMTLLRGGLEIVTIGEDKVAYIEVLCSDHKWYSIVLTTGATVPVNPGTALDNLNTTVAPVKTIINGQLIIIKDGVQYNAQGAILK